MGSRLTLWRLLCGMGGAAKSGCWALPCSPSLPKLVSDSPSSHTAATMVCTAMLKAPASSGFAAKASAAAALPKVSFLPGA